MEKEKRLAENEQAREIGRQAERKIMGGESVFITEENRLWIRKLLIDKDETILDLLIEEQVEVTDNEKLLKVDRQHCNKGYKDDEQISMWVAQTYFLAGTLKPEKFIELVSNVVGEISDNKEIVKSYVGEFFTNQLTNKARIKFNSDRAYRNGKSGKANLSKEEKDENKWKVKAIDDAVAVISSTYRWLEIIKSEIEVEAIVVQEAYETSRDLRERTIRGIEHKRKVDLVDIKRVWDFKIEGIKKFDEERKIMPLPVGTQGLILENLIR